MRVSRRLQCGVQLLTCSCCSLCCRIGSAVTSRTMSAPPRHHLGTIAGRSSPPGAGRVAELLPTRICFATFVIHQHAARAAFYLPNTIRQFLCFMNGYCRYHAGSLQHHAVTCSNMQHETTSCVITADIARLPGPPDPTTTTEFNCGNSPCGQHVCMTA